MLHIRLLVAGAAAVLMTSAGLAQTVTIVSGNGQITCPNCAINPIHRFEDLVVLVRDAAGNPVPNTTVNWSVSTAAGTIFSDASVASPTTTTDAQGRATNQFFQGPPLGISFASYSQANVTAAALGASAVFTETTTTSELGTGVSFIRSPVVESPDPIGTLITGRLGEPADPQIKVRVTTTTSLGLPGVALRLTPPEGVTYATTFGCQEAANGVTVLTDASGLATCTVIFGGQPGTGSIVGRIGGNFAATNPLNFSASIGRPWTITLSGGDNQSAGVGTNFAGPLVAVVRDAGGNTLSNAQVTWQIISGNGTLRNQVSTSDSNGRVSTNLTAGSTPGPLQVRVAANENASATYTFTANVTGAPADLQILSGNNQAAPVNTAFANPLMVQLSSQQSGITVNFAVTSGSVVLSSATALTDSTGRASVTATAGPTAGPAVVTASLGNVSRSFNLTVGQAGPQLTSNSFFNAASFARGDAALSPCGVAMVVAPGLAPGIQGAVLPPNLVGPLPTLLAGVSVQFGNSLAPIYNVSNMNGMETATFQVPCDAAIGNNQITVRAGSSSANTTVPVNAISPGVFQFQDTDGQRRAVILRPDGSFASAGNPARRGEIVRMYVTGIGPGQPAVGTNSPGIPGVQTQAQNPVIVGVNNAGVRVVSATLAENLIGIYEVAFEIPSDTAAGSNVPLGFAVDLSGQLMFGNGSAIAVQ